MSEAPPPFPEGLDPATVAAVPSPAFVVDAARLRRNLEILDSVQKRTGARILLALKGFAMFRTFPLIRRYLSGTCASGIDEARLGREEFGGTVHTFAPAFKEEEVRELLGITDHLVFNSFAQWRHFRPMVEAAPRKISCGLRVNPEHSEGATAIYDPCSRFSRLGIPAAAFAGEDLDGLEGLHFHTLCEQNSDALDRTLEVVERKWADVLPRLKWLNMGGGHHITREDYDIDRLCACIDRAKQRYGLDVYLEPGEAVALQTGFLVAEVVDIVRNEIDIAILDTSATAHMPDVLEMPYRPKIVGGYDPGERPHTYRLAGQTCLAGDVIGDWSFDAPLRPGDRLVFTDMGHYTMVKTTTFNGIRLPSIVLHDSADGSIEVVRRFTYEDYRDRLS